MKKSFLISVLFSFLLAIAGCSGSSSTGAGDSDSDSGGGSGSAPQLATVADLPSATSAVEDGSSASSLVKALGVSLTGMPLGSITSNDFDSDSSLAACDMFNSTKTAINQAGQGDLIQCYVTSTFDTFAASEGIDIYDGEYHIFALDFSGSSFEDGEEEGEGGGGPSKIKVKITKTDDIITSFEMFACGDMGSSDDEQSMYLKQTISGSDFSMTTVNMGSFGSYTFNDLTTVTGKLDSDGKFVDEVSGTASPKVIHMRHTFSDASSGSDFWADMSFSQYADQANMEATFSGTNSFGGNTCTFTDLVTAAAALLDGNSADTTNWQVGLLELGDGAASIAHTGSCGNDNTWEDTEVAAWTGADALALDDATASAYHSSVSDASLSAASEPTVAFDSDQTWDCSGTPDATIVFANLDVDVVSACSKYELNHSHIDCWHIMGNQGGEGPGEE